MDFEDLADVHPRRNAQRIQHNVNHSAVLETGHVFYRNHARHHTFVTVPACHLVPGLELPLDCYEDFD